MSRLGPFLDPGLERFTPWYLSFTDLKMIQKTVEFHIFIYGYNPSHFWIQNKGRL